MNTGGFLFGLLNNPFRRSVLVYQTQEALILNGNITKTYPHPLAPITDIFKYQGWQGLFEPRANLLMLPSFLANTISGMATGVALRTIQGLEDPNFQPQNQDKSLREREREWVNHLKRTPMGVGYKFLYVCISSCIGLAVTYPFVYLRTRLALDVKLGDGAKNRNLTVKSLYDKTIEKDGWQGLYRGFCLALSGTVLNAGIMALLEHFGGFSDNLERSWDNVVEFCYKLYRKVRYDEENQKKLSFSTVWELLDAMSTYWGAATMAALITYPITNTMVHHMMLSGVDSNQAVQGAYRDGKSCFELVIEPRKGDVNYLRLWRGSELLWLSGVCWLVSRCVMQHPDTKKKARSAYDQATE